MKLSIIIPTHSRVQEVNTLLLSISESLSMTNCTAEILLIDDSPMPQFDELHQFAVKFGATIHKGPRMVGAKRNFGAKLSRGTILFFVDSDCRFHMDALKYHLDAHEQHPEIAAFAGLVELAGDRNFIGNAIEQLGSFTAAFRFAAWSTTVDWAVTANLSVKKSAFESVGGFNENMPGILYGEDVDFGIRLNNNGNKIASLPQAIVFHPPSTINSVTASLYKVLRCGKADVVLQQQHPERAKICPPEGLTLAFLLLPWLSSNSLLLAILWSGSYLLLFSGLEALRLGGIFSKKAWTTALIGFVLKKTFIVGKLCRIITARRPDLLFMGFTYHPSQWLAGRDHEVRELWALAVVTLPILLYAL